MDGSPAPDPPPDYRAYTPDPDPSIEMFARVLAVGWLLAVVALGALVWFNHDHYTALSVAGIVLVTAVIHELLHAAVARALGLQVSGGFEFDGLASGPYILPYGGFQTRRESVQVAAAPTLVLTPIFLLLVVVGGAALALTALVGLFANTIGAVFDLRAVVTAIQLPAGALEYHTAEGEIQYFAPE